MPIQHCARPLFIQADHPDYPMYVSATGILGRLGDRPALLTAHHVLFPADARPEDPQALRRALLHTTLIDPERAGGGLIRFSNLHCGRITRAGATASFSDLALFLIDKRQSKYLKNLLPFYDIGNGGCLSEPRLGQQFQIFGFPSSAERPRIDYEKKLIDFSPIQMVAYFSGWEDVSKGIGYSIIDYIKYRDEFYTGALDGISGSPVILKEDGAYGLAGMVISAGGNKIRFISSFVIRELFKYLKYIPEDG